MPKPRTIPSPASQSPPHTTQHPEGPLLGLMLHSPHLEMLSDILNKEPIFSFCTGLGLVDYVPCLYYKINIYYKSEGGKQRHKTGLYLSHIKSSTLKALIITASWVSYQVLHTSPAFWQVAGEKEHL